MEMKVRALKKVKRGEKSATKWGGVNEQLKENSWYEVHVLLCAFDDQQLAGRSFSGVQS